MPLHVNFGAGLEYNTGDGRHLNYPNFAWLGERAICELRIRRSPTNPPLQPAYLSTLPGAFFVGRLFDSTHLPRLREGTQSADLAGSDFRGRLFFVLLAVPLQGTWDSAGNDRADLFWDHYRY